MKQVITKAENDMKNKCVECQFWTCAWDNSCCNPESKRYAEYVPSETEACELFEKEEL